MTQTLKELSTRPVSAVAEAVGRLIESEKGRDLLSSALRVRAVETVLLTLFKEGKLHGTIHTCLGQELVGVLLGGNLLPQDFVTSNHRCHGHFIGTTGDWRGLLDELIGNADGVSGGIGGSQHLCAKNFLSNGQQGGLLPVAVGIALDRKLRKSQGVVVSFIGEGTLGEGILYEVLNLASLWKLPLVIVCENNFYSQSTAQIDAVAGDIGSRARAFSWPVYKADTWDAPQLANVIEKAMHETRSGEGPAFVLVETYRLGAHSKGDDTRPADEVAAFNLRDPLNVLMESWPEYQETYGQMLSQVSDYSVAALSKPVMSVGHYLRAGEKEPKEVEWERVAAGESKGRIGQALNHFYTSYLASVPQSYLIGEDISDPYGGAFKITKGLSSKFPGRVFSTPISEAAIVGTGIGLAISGNRPLVEVMFGDFMSYAFDQLLNNASKFGKMYGQKFDCPLVVRTPVGGGRGYGPTHSQSLERFFVGMDGCAVVNVHSFLPVERQLRSLRSSADPIIIFENKVDYANELFVPPPGYFVEATGCDFSVVAVRPVSEQADLTIVSYGGAARSVADSIIQTLQQCDAIAELIILGRIYPLDIRPVMRSVDKTGRLLVVEEGVSFAGIGAEIIAQALNKYKGSLRAMKIGREEIPIPATPTLEACVLPNVGMICAGIRMLLEQ